MTDTKAAAVIHLDNVRIKEGRLSCQDVYQQAHSLVATAEDSLLDPGAVHQLVRKVDLRLMPIMCITYALQYYDKILLGHAAIYGLIGDLDLKADPLRYSNASMIFYVGYIIGCYPISYIAQRYPTGRVCAILCIIWSAIVLSTAGCTSYGGLLANRLFLGVVESGIAPSFMLIVSMWYNKREQLLRSAIWYSFSGGANLIAPVISFGVGHIHAGNLQAWQYMYLVAGSLTFLWSFIILFYLPDSPITATEFSQEEKAVILERMKSDNSGTLDRRLKPRQILECVWSVNFWCVNLMSMLTSVTAGPISSFGPIIFKDMGFTPSSALLLNIPNGALAFFCILASASLGRKFPNARLYLIMIGCPFVVLGACLVTAFKRATDDLNSRWQLSAANVAGRLAGFYLMNFFSFAYIQVVGLGTCNVAGYTKRTTMAASIFVFYCIGNIIGPLMFSQNDAPRYNQGFMGTMICLAFCFGIAALLRLHLAQQNARREAEHGNPGSEQGLEDITDRENKDFRYQL